jgi:hypothetical protein
MATRMDWIPTQGGKKEFQAPFLPSRLSWLVDSSKNRESIPIRNQESIPRGIGSRFQLDNMKCLP